MIHSLRSALCRTFALIGLLCAAAASAQDTDAIAILKKAAATYRNLKKLPSPGHGRHNRWHANFRAPFRRNGQRLGLSSARRKSHPPHPRRRWSNAMDTRPKNRPIGEVSICRRNRVLDSGSCPDRSEHQKRGDSSRRHFHCRRQAEKDYILVVERTKQPAAAIAGAQYATIRVDEETYQIAGSNIYADNPVEMLRYSLTERDQKLSVSNSNSHRLRPPKKSPRSHRSKLTPSLS